MTDRAQFEAHFGLTQRQQLRHRDDSYRDSSIQDRWLGWQAGQTGQTILPPLDAEMRKILGRPNFACIQLANNLRTLGYEIPAKSEEEQGTVIYWMLSLYMQHGKEWEAAARDILNGK